MGMALFESESIPFRTELGQSQRLSGSHRLQRHQMHPQVDGLGWLFLCASFGT